MTEPRTAIITDSASALSRELRLQHGITVVPLRVVVDGNDLSELAVDARWFYERLAAGAEITTSQPSPADLLGAFQHAAETGADRVWSIHLSGSLSGTLNAAAIAAREAPIIVELVDTGTASMPEGLCVMAAAAALNEDPDADVRAIVTAEAESQANIFVSLAPDVLERSGRGGLRFADPLPVLSMRASRPIEVVGSAADMNEAIRIMAGHLSEVGVGKTIAVGEGGAQRWGDALQAAVEQLGSARELLRYVVPPSIGSHAGPTVGAIVSDLRLSKVSVALALAE